MSMHKGKASEVYEIQVLGELDEGWQDWLNGLQAALTRRQPNSTTLMIRVSDQAALRGALCKLWDLNLTVVSLQRVEQNRAEAMNHE